MKLIAIYFNPKDYPGKYVLREWIGQIPVDECKVADSLEEIRKHIPKGWIRIPLDKKDDPKIIETWI